MICFVKIPEMKINKSKILDTYLVYWVAVYIFNIK